jgi:hypothetical protein
LLFFASSDWEEKHRIRSSVLSLSLSLSLFFSLCRVFFLFLGQQAKNAEEKSRDRLVEKD